MQKTNWTDQTITLRTDTTLAAPQFIIISSDASFGAGDLVLPLTNRIGYPEHQSAPQWRLLLLLQTL